MTNNEWENQFDKQFHNISYKVTPIDIEIGETKLIVDLGDETKRLKTFISTLLAQTRQDTVRELMEIAKSRMLEEKPFSSNPSESIHPSIYNKALTHLIGQLREDYNIKDA